MRMGKNLMACVKTGKRSHARSAPIIGRSNFRQTSELHAELSEDLWLTDIGCSRGQATLRILTNTPYRLPSRSSSLA